MVISEEMSANMFGDDPSSSSASSGKQSPISAKPSPLQHNYSLYWGAYNDGKSWEESFKIVEENINSINRFWKTFNGVFPPSRLELNHDYYFFKNGIRPMWEDKKNKNGGRIVLRLKRKDNADRHSANTRLDDCWMELIIAMIGEQFGEDSDYICGAAVCIRNNANKICLWISGEASVDCRTRMAKFFRETIQLRNGEHFQYEQHSRAAMRRNSSKLMQH